VPVYFDTPARDQRSGLYVAEAGCINLPADQALAYARSRAFQYYDDGRWRTDPTGDLGRMSRQQDFLRRALRRAVAQGVRNPIKLDELIDVGLDSVVVDDELTADDIVSLGNRFRSFDPENLTMYSLPVEADNVGGASIVRMVDSEAQPILDLFRTDVAEATPGDVDPTSVRVTVLNGSGRAGEARTALADLVEAGFAAVTADEADRFDYARTVVRYAPGDEAQAAEVARWLVAEPVFEPVSDLSGGDVVVVTGVDWSGVRSTPDAASAVPSSPSTAASTSTAEGSTDTGGTSTSAAAATSSTQPTTATSSTTATTVVGQVPEQPADVDC
jgi:hypothetical protein